MNIPINQTPLGSHEASQDISSLFGQAIYREDRFVSEKAVQRCIKKLHRNGESYENIAKRPEFEPIPFGTLRDIAVTGKVPEKWKEQLLLKRVYPPRIAIRKDDVESASQTIINNLGQKKTIQLIRTLQMQLNEQLENSWLRQGGQS